MMGEIRTELNLENDGDLFLHRLGKIEAEAIRRLTIDAMVGTDAVMLLLPQDAVEVLGLERVDRVIVTLANEQKIELEVAATLSVTICDRTMKTDCLVGPPRCEPLVGQILLERLDLLIDPVRRRISPRPESPYLPSLKLK
ncbi:MAG: hypothetical protein KAV82_09130 [Phycisphaerae bacterium]|nr:hypothetical protein [Phycisphaerae bacterium]